MRLEEDLDDSGVVAAALLIPRVAAVTSFRGHPLRWIGHELSRGRIEAGPEVGGDGGVGAEILG